MVNTGGTIGVRQIAQQPQQTHPNHSLRNFLKAIVHVVTFHWVVRLIEKQLHKRLLAMGVKLDYTAIHVHIFRPGLSFRDLRMSSSRRMKMFSVQLAEVAIQYRWKDLIKRRFLYFSKVLLHQGQISIQELDQFKQSFFPQRKPVSTTSRTTNGVMKKGWMVRDLDIEDITIDAEGEEGGHAHIATFVGSWQAKFYDMGVRFGVMHVPLKLKIDDIQITTLFKWHGFKTQSIDYDMEAREIRIADLRIYPKVEPDYLDEHETHIALHADLKVPEIVFSGLEWLHTDMLHWRVERIDVTKPVFWAYQNKEKPLRRGIRPMPPHWPDALPFKFMVETVDVTDAAVTYTFSPPSDKEIGRVSISEMDLRWEGYGNDITRPQAFTANAKMRWMEDAWMTASVTFPYEDATSSFILEGDISPADFVQFNPATVVASGLHFISGHWDTFKFQFDGNEEHIDGKIQIEFDDVKVGFEDQAPSFFENLKALAANTFVVRHSTHGEIREVEVSDLRNPQQSIFALWLKGLMGGFRKALLRV